MKEAFEKKELKLDDLDNISGGYIVKDDAGYHVIEDERGYEIHTFQEDQYDFMMRLIHDKWKISDEIITWEKAEEIRKKHVEEYFKGRAQLFVIYIETDLYMIRASWNIL